MPHRSPLVSSIRLAALCAVAGSGTACSGDIPPEQTSATVMHDERTPMLHGVLAAEREAGVGAVVWGDDGTLVVYVHEDRVTESHAALIERLSATYGVAVEVHDGAPVPADS